jgi:hypothetical protein
MHAWPLKHLGVSTLHVEIEEDACVGLIKMIAILNIAIPIFQIDHVNTLFGGLECLWQDINNYLEIIKNFDFQNNGSKYITHSIMCAWYVHYEHIKWGEYLFIQWVDCKHINTTYRWMGDLAWFEKCLWTNNLYALSYFPPCIFIANNLHFSPSFQQFWISIISHSCSIFFLTRFLARIENIILIIKKYIEHHPPPITLLAQKFCQTIAFPTLLDKHYLN